ncbi:MAG: hypothetical protein KF747_03635 [Nitrospira sp.]|nr:hypothetical protein [Nitrospira sp.]
MGQQDHQDSRDSALDFTKGVLVLFMLLYHWMNYFVGIDGPVYPYLRFIPASFIFISGFLLATVYPTKYGLNNSNLYLRLLVRGLKILALFTLLNVLANMAFSNSYRGAMPGVENFLNNAASIYIGGNGRMAFGVLLPIGYLLILSTLIFLGMQVTKYFVLVVCAASFVGVSLLDHYEVANPNFSFIAIGTLGMTLGQYPLQRIYTWAGWSWVMAGLYAGYLIAINIWGERYFLEVIGVCLSVLLIYGAGITIREPRVLVSTVVLLGQYSLYAYIAQIGLLQFLQRSLVTVDVRTGELWALSIIGAFALTILIVWATHQMCLRSPTLDKMYRLVFT